MKDILNLFPHQAPDQAAFTAEFEVFVNVVNEGNTTNRIRSLADAAKEAEKRSTFSRSPIELTDLLLLLQWQEMKGPSVS